MQIVYVPLKLKPTRQVSQRLAFRVVIEQITIRQQLAKPGFMYRYCDGSCLPSFRFVVFDEAVLRTVDVLLVLGVFFKVLVSDIDVVADNDGLERGACFVHDHVVKECGAEFLQVSHDVLATAVRFVIFVPRHPDMNKT
jgi:hypothetical protein